MDITTAIYRSGKMKIKILIIVSVMILASITACNGKPVAVFETTSHDFGIVEKSSSVKYSFQFKNTGNSTLIIERIKTG